MAAKHDRTRRDAPDGIKEKSKPHAKGPWPDAKAREEMSRADAERDNLGKHSKNPDWEKKW